ncbi:ATP-binding cassette domain-containing protein [Paenibacillus sp. MMS20-IR301]|uniref:ABC transporter ATP-binding protein n=1 Tax=Paenibacillus sp. MMS20-IR301 TaxID=2895946 RepID=UPI0028EC060C|nr:ATP-binding cassette domain-containing protein [Paenibacillus sp. MMS20-IR301]WNS45981.1 ATP-binding cassette domain-containing protein [Paenibacillus sp. MMS20-IR301]
MKGIDLMINEEIIQVRNLKRTYQTTEGMFKRKRRTVEALQGITFSVHEGEIIGLLGPNGAGKTTTIKILTTMLAPTSGEVRILGLDPVKDFKQLRPRINFILGGERNLYWRLSAYDNLVYFADLYRVPRLVQKSRIPQLLELVGLTEVAHRRVETFSKGMKQKLQIARGLINDPKILFLDEPTIGLDPVSARQLRDILRGLKQQGTTILLTTHYMPEADELCDRIAFINQGLISILDTPEELKKRIDQISVIACSIPGLTEEEHGNIANHPAVLNLQAGEPDQLEHLRIQTRTPQELVMELYSIAGAARMANLSITTPTLEDVYIQMIGGEVS